MFQLGARSALSVTWSRPEAARVLAKDQAMVGPDTVWLELATADINALELLAVLFHTNTHDMDGKGTWHPITFTPNFKLSHLELSWSHCTEESQFEVA